MAAANTEYDRLAQFIQQTRSNRFLSLPQQRALVQRWVNENLTKEELQKLSADNWKKFRALTGINSTEEHLDHINNLGVKTLERWWKEDDKRSGLKAKRPSLYFVADDPEFPITFARGSLASKHAADQFALEIFDLAYSPLDAMSLAVVRQSLHSCFRDFTALGKFVRSWPTQRSIAITAVDPRLQKKYRPERLNLILQLVHGVISDDFDNLEANYRNLSPTPFTDPEKGFENISALVDAYRLVDQQILRIAEQILSDEFSNPFRTGLAKLNANMQIQEAKASDLDIRLRESASQIPKSNAVPTAKRTLGETQNDLNAVNAGLAVASSYFQGTDLGDDQHIDLSSGNNKPQLNSLISSLEAIQNRWRHLLKTLATPLDLVGDLRISADVLEIGRKEQERARFDLIEVIDLAIHNPKLAISAAGSLIDNGLDSRRPSRPEVKTENDLRTKLLARQQLLTAQLNRLESQLEKLTKRTKIFQSEIRWQLAMINFKLNRIIVQITRQTRTELLAGLRELNKPKWFNRAFNEKLPNMLKAQEKHLSAINNSGDRGKGISPIFWRALPFKGANGEVMDHQLLGPLRNLGLSQEVIGKLANPSMAVDDLNAKSTNKVDKIFTILLPNLPDMLLDVRQIADYSDLLLNYIKLRAAVKATEAKAIERREWLQHLDEMISMGIVQYNMLGGDVHLKSLSRRFRNEATQELEEFFTLAEVTPELGRNIVMVALREHLELAAKSTADYRFAITQSDRTALDQLFPFLKRWELVPIYSNIDDSMIYWAINRLLKKGGC